MSKNSSSNHNREKPLISPKFTLNWQFLDLIYQIYVILCRFSQVSMVVISALLFNFFIRSRWCHSILTCTFVFLSTKRDLHICSVSYLHVQIITKKIRHSLSVLADLLLLSNQALLVHPETKERGEGTRRVVKTRNLNSPNQLTQQTDSIKFYFEATFITLVSMLLSAPTWWKKWGVKCRANLHISFSWLEPDIHFPKLLWWCGIYSLCCGHNKCPCQTWLNWWEAVNDDKKGLFTCGPGGPGFPFVTSVAWFKKKKKEQEENTVKI